MRIQVSSALEVVGVAVVLVCVALVDLLAAGALVGLAMAALGYLLGADDEPGT